MTTKRAKPNSPKSGPTEFAFDDLKAIAFPSGEFLLNRYVEKPNPPSWYYKECECGVDVHEYIALAVVGPDQEVGR